MKNTTTLFSIRKWPTGHILVCLFNWTADWNPVRGTWWFMNRPWPSTRRGLSASEMRSFHIRLKRR
jgi:hypothetical protein